MILAAGPDLQYFSKEKDGTWQENECFRGCQNRHPAMEQKCLAATCVSRCLQKFFLARVSSSSKRLSGPQRGTIKSSTMEHWPPVLISFLISAVSQHWGWLLLSPVSPKVGMLQAAVPECYHHILGWVTEHLYFLVPRTGKLTLSLS